MANHLLSGSCRLKSAAMWGTHSAVVQPRLGGHFRLVTRWVHDDVVGAPHRIYHDGFNAISDDEADARDTIIGHIPNLSSICKPQPPSVVLAVTPIDFSVLVPKFHELVLHVAPVDGLNVVSAKCSHVLARAEQISWLHNIGGFYQLSSAGRRHAPRRPSMQSRTDPIRARRGHIKQLSLIHI